MKKVNNFKIVLGFELKEYFKSKGFLITTFLLAALAVIGLSLPRFIDLGFNKGIEGVAEQMFSVDGSKVVVYDKDGYLNKDIASQAFPQIRYVDSEAEIESAVTDKSADKGFSIKSPTSFKAYVYNSEMYGKEENVMTQLMSVQQGMKYAESKGVTYEELSSSLNPKIESESIILGKDTRANYWYCYALVIIIFMMVIMYGNMIATSVATEKSNRSVEVLVTSTSTNSVLFGKVIAGAIASIFQMTMILGALIFTYRANREAWGHMLDPILNIPLEVFGIFLLFGLFGYLFFAFIYGSVGALVSKTEDISKTSSGIMMVIMVVYFLSLFQLSNPDGIVMRVFSYLPFSSYSAMFARVALGTVSPVEVIISFIILLASVVGMGLLSAKIYRMGTMRYGNPISIRAAIKAVRKEK